MKKIHVGYFRNLIFGAEDSLVSTVGVLFGVASTGEYSARQVIITGLIVIAVEALSMGAGSFLTEESLQELDGEKIHKDKPYIEGLIMFLSYVIAGFIVLSPYLFIRIEVAKFVSVIFALLSLYLVGYLPRRNYKSGLRMLTIAGLAILVGFIIGEALG